MYNKCSNNRNMDARIKKYCDHIIKSQKYVLRRGKDNKTHFWDCPAAVSVCYFNGMSKNGYSHFSKNTVWAEPIRQKIKKIGELGHGSPISRNPLGNCAEQHSGNNLMKAYKKVKRLEQLNFTETVRPRTMEIIIPCNHCKKIFPNLK